MGNQIRNRKIAQALSALVMLSVAQIPLFATIEDRIEYKLNRVLTEVQQINNTVNPPGQTFDFIIVGSGIGGSVLAGRLTENPDFSVCLLEAGQDIENPLIPFPISWPFLYFNATHDWSFWTEPLNGDVSTRLFAWTRAKMLGGCSNHNAVQWSWGGQFVYNNWETNLGLSEWGYNDIQPYLQKAEHVFGLLDGQPVNYSVRGDAGPIPVRQTSVTQPAQNEFLNFSRAAGPSGLGLATFSDLNLATVPGFSWAQQNVDENYLRVSAYDAYVRPFVNVRENLNVKVGAVVTRIILDQNNVAKGVEYISQGQLKYAYANKEVLLCAGVAQSPKILMHSGVGPSAVLSSTLPQAIPLRLDLPGVGQNVQDHIFPVIVYGVNKIPDPIVPGPFAPFSPFTNFLDMDGFMSLTNSNDLDFELVPILAPASVVKEVNLFNSYIANGTIPAPVGTAFFIEAAFLLTQNLSRGAITVYSNNPLDPPIITPPYFNDTGNQDITRLIATFKKVRNIFAQFTTWLQNSPSNLLGENLQITGEVIPGPSVTTDAEIQAYLEASATPSTHQVGGCSMGLSPLDGAVVDQHFKVYGINHLRVVDGSTLPTITQTRPQATIYAMAERAADFIKADNL